MIATTRSTQEMQAVPLVPAIHPPSVDPVAATAIEPSIAEALNTTGEYNGVLTAGDVEQMLMAALPTVVNRSVFHCHRSRVTCEVEAVQVRLARQELHANCYLNITHPIRVGLFVSLVLENDPTFPGLTLRLKPESLHVMERLQVQDTATRRVLDLVDVWHIAERELLNPCNVLMQGLIRRLMNHGFQHPLSSAAFWLSHQEDVRLSLSIWHSHWQ